MHWLQTKAIRYFILTHEKKSIITKKIFPFFADRFPVSICLKKQHQYLYSVGSFHIFQGADWPGPLS